MSRLCARNHLGSDSDTTEHLALTCQDPAFTFRFREHMATLKGSNDFYQKVKALKVLYVPYSLDSGLPCPSPLPCFM